MKKYNVESFSLDHTKVVAPYVRLAGQKVGKNGDVVSKYDIRFCQPNHGCMGTGEIHTLEHLVAEYIRDEVSDVIDFSPMGCRTGFYFTVFGSYPEKDIFNIFRRVLSKIAVWNKEIPAVNERECGNYRDHDLEGARQRANNWVKCCEIKGFRC